MEAMHAHFVRHVYHRHSHETYSFGFTEEGAQSFTCRGAAHTSAAGMVMVFNPDDPHDGHATDEAGFTYRMVHIGPELVADVLREAAGRRVGLPLFAEPVMPVPGMAGRLRLLHQALVGGGASVLRRDELLDGVVAGMARHARVQGWRGGDGAAGEADAGTARVVREMVHYTEDHGVSAGDLAAAVGRSRFAVYRSFRAVYGMAPSDYQRQVRLRAARRLLVQGRPLAEVAAETGFTDQSHLTRWFTRYFGVTPGAYRRAAASP
ncbi:AraC-like DNA-binding protein [Sphaerisporangium siamense]|uniref:AraC-like DNA-binding protein n=2 Tax=Sphaerisporangium siamense TaxID=795645 RepID=A0A7W7D6G1_9ACTN|nr:AraC-like DNA-binding protein [Sphaerisporangium siamense]